LGEGGRELKLAGVLVSANGSTSEKAKERSKKKGEGKKREAASAPVAGQKRNRKKNERISRPNRGTK